MLPPRLVLDQVRRRRLVAVASGRQPADLVLRGGRVLNVFTEQLEPRAIGIAEGRIAWLREEPGPAAEELDLDGAVVVPGLIDAHCHADIVTTPSAFADAVVGHGTTAGVVDTLALVTLLDDARLQATVARLEQTAFKFLWGLRLSRDQYSTEDPQLLPTARLRKLMAELPGVVSAGELTAWPALTGGDERHERFVTDMLSAGHRIDGHTPGASPRTLAQLAAAGLTSDHEAIDGEELLTRMSLGYWTMIRQSSLRKDAQQLAETLARSGLPSDRVLLTTDGLIPQELAAGHLDGVVRLVTAGGIPAARAVRMATLHPATYLGLDGHLGAVAAGRCADLLVVDELERFTPLRTFSDGIDVAAAPPPPAVDWGALRLPLGVAELSAETLVDVCTATDVAIRFQGAIARRAARADDARPVLAAIVRRDGRVIAGTTLEGFDVPAVATTCTGSRDVLLLGREPDALVDAYAAVVSSGGGMACPDATLALPVLAHLHPGSVQQAAGDLMRFERAAGLPADDLPFFFRSLFLTLPALPGVCLTPDGVLDVRTAERLTAGRPLELRSAPAGTT